MYNIEPVSQEKIGPWKVACAILLLAVIVLEVVLIIHKTAQKEEYNKYYEYNINHHFHILHIGDGDTSKFFVRTEIIPVDTIIKKR